MKKDYIVYYWRCEQAEEGSNCNYNFKEFYTVTEAINYFKTLTTKEKFILKLVAWKTIDITK